MAFLRFLLSRLLTYVVVVWIGITVTFFVPRFAPADPVQAMLARVRAQGTGMEAEQYLAWAQSLRESFGLEGTLGEQYLSFFKRVLIDGDFGPSLTSFPTPVRELVGRALPWTFGLLLTSTIIAWLLGNGIGLIAGYWKEKRFSAVLEGFAVFFYPIPYYILALALIILFAYKWPIFPFTFSTSGEPGSLRYIGSVVQSTILPALSIVIVSLGWWVISMKTLSASIAEEDFVHFARLKGVGDRRIMGQYVMRNALLPQVTVLALQLGGIFNGALITEILFGYPGVGTLIYQAVLQSDYNLMMGAISVSTIAVATAALFVDLLYPLIDPRIRHK